MSRRLAGELLNQFVSLILPFVHTLWPARSLPLGPQGQRVTDALQEEEKRSNRVVELDS